MPSSLASVAALACVLVLWSASAEAQTSLSIHDRVTPADEDRISQALAKRGSLDAINMPLSDVATLLSQRFGENIVISRKKLEEQAIGLDTPVTAQLNHLPLESMLNVILGELDLTFTVRDNVIVITSRDDANSPESQEIRVYPVRDLLDRYEDGYDFDPLIEMITTTIDPVSWDEVGGPGSLSGIDTAGSLTVAQSWHNHRKIERLLETLRRAKTAQGLPDYAAVSTTTRRTAASAVSRSAPSTPRRYVDTAATQSWQLPRLHSDE